LNFFSNLILFVCNDTGKRKEVSSYFLKAYVITINLPQVFSVDVK